MIFQSSSLKIISHYKKIGCNINVLQQTACLVVNPMKVGNFAFLFNCTLVDWVCLLISFAPVFSFSGTSFEDHLCYFCLVFVMLSCVSVY